MNNHFDFIFNRTNKPLTIEVDSNGIPWFYATEIASFLGYSRSRDMVRMLSSNECILMHHTGDNNFTDSNNILTTHIVRGQNGGAQEFYMINEPGLYRIAISSRSSRPEVEEFKNWVFYEVLPSIRQFGAYVSPEIRTQLQINPNYINNIIAQNEEYEKRIKDLEHQASLQPLVTDLNDNSDPLVRHYNEQKQFIEENKSNITIGKAVSKSDRDITIDEFAKILASNGYPAGRYRIFAEFRKDGFLIKYGPFYNNPTEEMISAGFMKVARVVNPIGEFNVTLITPVGFKYLLNFYIDKLNRMIVDSSR